MRVDQYHVDILTAHFVRNPDWFDVVVASNLFGDILSDLGPACTGTIGIAPSANLNPTRAFPSLFEPVHGSAPDIAGQGIANPIGQIWSRGDDARLPRPGTRRGGRALPGRPRRDPPRDRTRLRARAADAGHGRHRVDRGGRPGDRGGDLSGNRLG